jgi:hypothetical protein
MDIDEENSLSIKQVSLCGVKAGECVLMVRDEYFISELQNVWQNSFTSCKACFKTEGRQF